MFFSSTLVSTLVIFIEYVSENLDYVSENS